MNALTSEAEKIRGELVSDDNGFKVTAVPVKCESFMSNRRSLELIALLKTSPHRSSHDEHESVPGLVETSSNLAVIRKAENGFEIVVSVPFLR